MNNIRKFIYPLTLTCMLLLLMMGCKKHETFTVTFDANGGQGQMSPQVFMEGIEQSLTLNTFIRKGYTFSGWNGNGLQYIDGQKIVVNSDMTLYAQWQVEQSEENMLNGHKYVDLGLPSGTKWATCNVGANNPEDYGGYYAWGETNTKSTYNWIYYKYCNGSPNSLTKYCSSDNLTILEESDDAAYVNWGRGWRTPTYQEFQELYDFCSQSWTATNGINGCLFTSLVNGNTIFLPAAGYHYEDELYKVSHSGYYWSRDLGKFKDFSSNILPTTGYTRIYGFSVRPVCVN